MNIFLFIYFFIYLGSMSIQTFCIKKDSFTWFQIAAIVWFLSFTLSKIKVLCRYLRIFIHFSLIFGKLMIVSITLFLYLLNKIVLNFKVFKLMAFLAFFIFFFIKCKFFNEWIIFEKWFGWDKSLCSMGKQAYFTS